MERIEIGHFEKFDIEHIGNKYRLEIDPDHHYLIEHLEKGQYEETADSEVQRGAP